MKKIFFLCPKFHNFEAEIKIAIEKLDFSVTLFYEKPWAKYSFFHSLYMKSPAWLRQYLTNSYFNKVLAVFDKSYDYFILIRGEVVPASFLSQIRSKANDKARFIMYQWDYLDAVPNVKRLFQYFDDIYTFDYIDAEKNKLHFKPLFYTQSHAELSRSCDIKYSVSFIGTHHSDRYKIIERFLRHNKKLAKNSFVYLYRPMHSFIYNRLLKKDMGGLSLSKARAKLNANKSKKIMSQSQAIFDIHHEKQAGVTIRTLEAVGLKKKLITTNPYIVYHDFYHPDNVCIVSRDDMSVSDDFLAKMYCELPVDIYQKYHIENWVKEFFANE